MKNKIPEINQDTIVKRIACLKNTVEKYLPEVAQAIKLAVLNKESILYLNQDAFAMDYQDKEYDLLGKAIKYAGIFGLEILIVGKNRETLNQPPFFYSRKT